MLQNISMDQFERADSLSKSDDIYGLLNEVESHV